MEGYTEVFAWGGDYFGQLGLGNKHSGKTYASPRFCSFNILIKELSCGEEHSSFISFSGHVYSMGSNSEGRLGLGDKTLRSSPSPCLVEGLSNYRCFKISCGWGHTAVITEEGNVFTWGVGEFGALATGSNQNAWAPVKCLIPRSMRGLNVSCGSRHTVLVVEENMNKVLLVSGSGEAGQLGTGKREKEFSFVAVNFNEDPVQAAAGIFHTLVLASSGNVWATGGNSFGQLGLGNKKSTSRFEKVAVDGVVVKVAAGNHSAAVTENGQLFIWGTGVFGEYLSPTRLSVGFIKDVDIGGSFGVALDTNGRLISWGANTNGELGNGDYEPKIAPCIIPSLKPKTVKKLSCGGNYVLALGIDIVGEFSSSANFANASNNSFAVKPAKNNERNENDTKIEIKKRSVREGKIRTASAEGEKFRNYEYENRKTDNLNAIEIEKLSLNYKVATARLEDLKVENARMSEKIVMNRTEMQRLVLENEELRKIADGAGSGVKFALEENQRQNLILMQENKGLKDEIFRLKRQLDDSKYSSKLEISNQFEELSISLQQKHSYEIQELRTLQEQDSIKRKQAEKNLDLASKHIKQLESALSQSNSEISDLKRTNQDHFLEFDSHKQSLQHEIEKYYKENSELRRKLESTQTEKQRNEHLMKTELHSYTSDYSELQNKLEKISLEKEKISMMWKNETDKNQQDLSEYRKKVEILTIEKEKNVKSLQTEIFNQGIQMDELRKHLEKISAENKEMIEKLTMKNAEVAHMAEDLSGVKTELSYYKQANEDLKYQLSKFQKQGSDNVHKIDLMRNGMADLEENYKMVVAENRLLKESVSELEMKNRQLFDNLEKELAQRAKEYKERTIQMLSTPNRSTSPYVRPTTPMTHTRDKSDDVGNTAAKLLDVLDSPKSVKTSQYLNVPQVYKGSTTPTKDDVRVRIASLMKNRSRIEEQLNTLNYEY